MLLGPTGVGKSTTLHYASGSQMVWECVEHPIYHVSNGELGPNVLNREELANV